MAKCIKCMSSPLKCAKSTRTRLVSLASQFAKSSLSFDIFKIKGKWQYIFFILTIYNTLYRFIISCLLLQI
jgi:hypothetical protein